MYMSTAALTGMIVLAMLLTRPPTILIGRLVVLFAAFCLIGLTLPYRKGIAMAIEYLVETRWNRSTHPADEQQE